MKRLIPVTVVATCAAFVLASQQWVDYTSPYGCFSISFPSQYKIEKKSNKKMSFESASLDVGKISYEALVEDFENIPEFRQNPITFMDKAIVSVKSGSWTPRDVKAFNVNGRQGRLATYTRGTEQMRTYLIADGNYLVIVSVNGPAGVLESQDTTKYFNSFRLK